MGHTAGHSDPVEAALAKGIEAATVAGEWSVVAQLARELEARRVARENAAEKATKVIDFASRRERK